jgi:hypothetical protein
MCVFVYSTCCFGAKKGDRVAGTQKKRPSSVYYLFFFHEIHYPFLVPAWLFIFFLAVGLLVLVARASNRSHSSRMETKEKPRNRPMFPPNYNNSEIVTDLVSKPLTDPFKGHIVKNL